MISENAKHPTIPGHLRNWSRIRNLIGIFDVYSMLLHFMKRTRRKRWRTDVKIELVDVCRVLLIRLLQGVGVCSRLVKPPTPDTRLLAYINACQMM